MIYSLCGQLIHKEPSLAIVECGGVGYGCRTTFSTLSQVGEIGSKVKLFTFMSVRQDAMELFGFATQQELNCFKMLTSVTGVGPKAGLAILSDLSPEKFALVIATSDVKAITKVKGVGPKIAQRIILELKDKIVKEQQMFDGIDIDFTHVADGSVASEAISALVVLGYSQSEASVIISKLDSTLSVEEMIRQGLKGLAMKL